MTELDEQMKSAKMLLFDAKVQFKSNEISENTFETVKSCTNELIEHVTHETAEISNVQRRIADLDLEVQNVTAPPQKQLQESAVSYLDTQEGQSVETILPEAPIDDPVPEPTESTNESEALPQIPEPPQQVTAETSQDNTSDNDWLARMEAQ